MQKSKRKVTDIHKCKFFSYVGRLMGRPAQAMGFYRLASTG